MSTQILWYDEQERPKGVLAYDSAVHEEDLDGTDKLTVVTRRNAEKRDRLIWKDNAGYWHEHIVDEISTTHHGGAKRHTLTCSNSISELFRIEAPGTKAKKRVSEHLADVCAGTRWNAGNSSGTVVEVETWHKSVRECMTELCSQCDGELVTHINVDDNGVINRTVRIVVDYGTNVVRRTFTYGHNMGAVKREVAADEVYTAVRGYGAKIAETSWQAHIDELQDQYDESTDSDERAKLQKRINVAREKLKAVQDNDYAERLKVEVKKGDSKRKRWGVFNGLAMVHSWYIYTDNNCTDRQFLRRQCNALLKSLCNPLVRYEFDTAEVDSEMWHDVRLGSKVLCVDPVFEGGAAIERVSHIKRNLSGTMQCRIAIGKRANPQIDQYKTTQRLSRITTGNGVKTQSYTPTSSGGNYSGVGGYSPIGQYEVDGETYTIGDGAQPAAIQVITPPAKTEYYVNDEIDYSGIEVQLLDDNGEVYTSDAYPDGVIPFDELEFPVETVDDSEVTTSSTGTATVDDTTGLPQDVISNLPLPFINAQAYQYDGMYTSGTKDVDRIAVANLVSEDTCFVFSLKNNNNNKAPYIVSKKPFSFDSKRYNQYGQYSNHVTSSSIGFSIDGRLVAQFYYGMVTGTTSSSNMTENVTSINASFDKIDECGYVILFGTQKRDANYCLFDTDLSMSDFDIFFNKPISAAKVITAKIIGYSGFGVHGDVICTYEIDDGYLIPINNQRGNEKLTELYAVSKNPDAIITTTRVGIGEGMDIFDFVRTSWVARNSEPTLISRTTFYSNIVISWNENPNSEISVPLNYTKERITQYYEDFVCQIGTIIFDGNKTDVGDVGKINIPVEWNDLSDSFEIEVSGNPIEYSTSAFESTGGGRF